MLLLRHAAWAVPFLSTAFATPSPVDELRTRQTSDDACDTIYDDYPTSVSADETHYFSADLADRCLRSVPFDQDLAKLQFREVETFLQLYSAQAFWKNPPESDLDIDAYDLNATLSEIEAKVNDDDYPSTYEFNLDLTRALAGLYDGHTRYAALCSDVFIFTHEYPLVSVAGSPVEPPRIHIGSATSDGGSTVGDEVVEINGQDPSEYLADLAATGLQSGFIDKDARFNDLFLQTVVREAVLRVKPGWGTFARRDHLDKTPLNITLENGTTIDVKWRAELNYLPLSSDGGPVGQASLPFGGSMTFGDFCLNPEYTDSDEGDVYSYANFDPTATYGDSAASASGLAYSYTGTELERRQASITSSPTSTPTKAPRQFTYDASDYSEYNTYSFAYPSYSGYSSVSVPSSAPTAAPLVGFPTPIAKMPFNQMSLHSLGEEVGVIGIHSFNEYPFAAGGGSSLLTDTFNDEFIGFLTHSIAYLKNNGFSKVILDVRNNGGGRIDAGYSSLSQFFPTQTPFYGQDYRWSPALDYLMRQVNGDDAGNLVELYPGLAFNLYNQKSGGNFESIDEFLAPQLRNGGYFTSIARSDVDQWEEELGYDPPRYRNIPFDTDDIVIVSNSLCASACAVFTEAMQERGVRSVAFGGRPDRDRMQAVGGVKGGQVTMYEYFLAATQASAGASSSSFLARTPPYALSLQANFKNSYGNSSDVPLEFRYTAATSKLSFTADMIEDTRHVWSAAAGSMWDIEVDVEALPTRTSDPAESPPGSSTWPGQNDDPPSSTTRASAAATTILPRTALIVAMFIPAILYM
ncbi:MAG: hypothetical protein M1837_001876 [Sclerophora amabilis]|nr:MAG: hypothetical protein M1837_001876 [Sclerophora amabilis]